MALHKRGKWWYGDSQADIRDELTRVGNLNEYVPTQFADARCLCGGRTFLLRLDEGAGAAIRVCSNTCCASLHAIGDSNEYLDDAELEDCACPCGGDEFEITVGVHLYSGSDDVKWLYVGCRCPACGLTATYGDWKNEFIDYRKVLARV
jgi:hypothetical protein